MSMERNIITMGESGNIIMPENTTDIWMSEPELVELPRHSMLPSKPYIKAAY